MTEIDTKKDISDTDFAHLCVISNDVCPDGLVSVCGDRILKVNRRAQQIFGVGDSVFGSISGRKIQEFIRPHPSQEAQPRQINEIVAECLESGTNHLVLPVQELAQSGAFEMRVWPIDDDELRKNLMSIDEEATLPTGSSSSSQIYVMRLSSVSGQISQNYSLRHVQKLEALGALMGGVAHEINTPSQFVGDSLSYLRDAFSLLLSHISDTDEKFVLMQEDVKQALDQAVEGMDRIRTIASAVREFARKDGTDAVGTDLNHLIETAVIVARNSYKYVADIELDLQSWPPMIPCFPGDIQQVLLNLIINSAHAIEDHQDQSEKFERGTILIRSRYDDDFAHLEVADTGVGITQEVQSSAFSPYFTTKAVGRGTGQGLSLCRKVATAHNGQIEIFNHKIEELGPRGACVRFSLPLQQTDPTPRDAAKNDLPESEQK